MGLLDDAIREHLELKRKHGADPDEAATAASEQETELFDAGPGQETELEEPEGALDEPESALDEPETALDQPGEAPQGEAEFEGVPEPENMPPSPAPFDADTAFEGFSERDAPDEGEEEEPEDRHEPDRDEPDVLEDTPDFLQETPEHDRLWFEQKPPRDFDFD